MPSHAKFLDAVSEAMSIKYNNRVYEMKAQGRDVIVLSLGEAFFEIPLFPMDDLPQPDIFHYSHSRGILPLRQRLAAYYRDEYGVPVDADAEIIVTSGSKIAVHMAFMAILEPDDEVVIHEPAWVSYGEQVKLCRAVPVFVPHHVPVSQLGRYVTSRTKAIVVNNPHNPRGWVMRDGELEYLHRIARSESLFLVADEAYSDFVLPEDHFVSCATFDATKEHTIVCNSMSKNYGMSGWRIGYVIANRELIQQLLKINQHLITCPATVLQHYLVQHFDDVLRITKPQIRELLERRRVVGRHLDALGLQALPGSSTFYFFVSIAPSSLRSEDFCDRLLEEAGVCVVPGVGYGPSCDEFIRISIGAEPLDRTRRGVQAVKDLIVRTAR